MNETPLFPITKVVLSKTGIGYYERKDRVEGSATFDLYFKASDMNDVLKSLVCVCVCVCVRESEILHRVLQSCVSVPGHAGTGSCPVLWQRLLLVLIMCVCANRPWLI